MPNVATQPCPDHQVVEALAADTLAAEERRRAQRHLEHCASCRTAFRNLTAERYPRLRGYTVVEQIGAGAYGNVYRAVHHAMERTEALKVLHAETRLRTESFENEIRLIAQLQHPNIATLFDAHLGTPPVYYTMEFVEGRQLDQYLRLTEVSVAERVEILRRVALAMKYAHEQGVVHLDLKPQNILIDDAGRPRIVDFGIARKLALADSENTTTQAGRNHPQGTDGYIAPEELAGRPVDGRADVYALGVLLYQSLTGEAWGARTRLKDLAATLRHRRISRARDLAAVIDRCLQEAPKRRYPTCAALAQDLGDYLVAGPVSAWPRHTPGYRAARGATRALGTHPKLVRRTLLLAVTVLLGALFHTLSPGLLARGAESGGQVVLAAFDTATLGAIRDRRIGTDLEGFSLSNRKSWRMLYGRIMQRLAQASPRAVVWDYFFPDCHPEFDAAFLQGVDALQSKGIPVVVGCRDFDVNGEPIGCQHILDKVHACGAILAVDPDKRDNYRFFAPLCIQRGLAAPIPTLALAGFAAARYPECEPSLRIEDAQVRVCYRRKQYARGEPAWRAEVDAFSVTHREPDRRLDILEPDDEVLSTPVAQADPGEWDQRVVSCADVLTGSRDQLQRWFSGRVVFVGQVLPGQDVYQTWSNPEIYGCQVQAQVLDEFLARSNPPRFSALGLWLRCLFWCVLGSILTSLLPVGRYGTGRVAKLACVTLCTLGILVGVMAFYLMFSGYWAVEAAISVCALLVAGSLTYLCRGAQARLARIAPGPDWPDARDVESAGVAGRA